MNKNATEIEWPREIWMAERDEHDQGVVRAVLWEHATVARWEGDSERDREFHHYIDADIYDSAQRYHDAKLAEITAERDTLAKQAEEIQTLTGQLAEARDLLEEVDMAISSLIIYADRAWQGEVDAGAREIRRQINCKFAEYWKGRALKSEPT